MFAKTIVLRYGYALEDPQEREAFLAAIEQLKTSEVEGIIMVTSAAIYNALEGTPIEHLSLDFNTRWCNFTDPRRDLPGKGDQN